MKKRYVGKTKNGFAVYVDTEVSHAMTHFADAPQLLDVVKEVIADLEVHGRHMRFDKDMGRQVGEADIAETNEQDDVVYALRPNRKHYARFVKNKTGTPTNYVTLDLRASGKNEYNLYTAFIGRLTPSFPGGDYLPEQSGEFWSKHALIWGKQEIVPGTETKRCPW